MRHLLIAVLLGGLPLVCGTLGCGSGGEPSGYDLNGWWELSTREAGSGLPLRTVLIVSSSHSGTTFIVFGVTLTQDGSSLTGTYTDPGGSDTEYDLEILGNDHIEGTVTQHSDVQDLRLLRAPTPQGTLTANGTIGTEPVTVNSMTAYAASVEDTSSNQYTVSVSTWSPAHVTVLGVRFDDTPPLAARQYDVGTNPGEIRASLNSGNIQEISGANAVAGFVTFSLLTTDHVTGAYELTLNGGGLVSGTFDAPILLEEVN